MEPNPPKNYFSGRRTFGRWAWGFTRQVLHIVVLRRGLTHLLVDFFTQRNLLRHCGKVSKSLYFINHQFALPC
jgi:hypothetical protein